MHPIRITFLGALLLLSACGSTAPAPNRETASQVRVSAEGVFGRLLRMNLPDGWKTVDRSEQDGTAIVALPDVIDHLNDAETDHGFFVVRPLTTNDCAASSIVMQARISQGEKPRQEDRPVELTRNGGTYGYSWFGWNGVAGGETIPDWHYWCIDSSRPFSDIEIRAKRSDEPTEAFIEKAFIPAWLALEQERFAELEK